MNLSFDATDPCFYEVHSTELISISTIDKTNPGEPTALGILLEDPIALDILGLWVVSSASNLQSIITQGMRFSIANGDTNGTILKVLLVKHSDKVLRQADISQLESKCQFF